MGYWWPNQRALGHLGQESGFQGGAKRERESRCGVLTVGEKAELWLIRYPRGKGSMRILWKVPSQSMLEAGWSSGRPTGKLSLRNCCPAQCYKGVLW